MEWRLRTGLAGPVQTDTRRLIREVQVLRKLRHPNLVTLTAAYALSVSDPFAATESNDSVSAPFDVYLVFEMVDMPLSSVIREHAEKTARKRPGLLTCWHVVWLTYQLLHGLHAMHAAGVTHRDIKPHNLLVRQADSVLQICDFGLARASASQGVVSDYVQTRWYRCPELLWQQRTLEPSMDIWSAGCVLAELLTGEVLFRHGSTRTGGMYDGQKASRQLVTVIDYLGKPSTEDIDSIEAPTPGDTQAVRGFLRAIGDQHLPSGVSERKIQSTLEAGAHRNGLGLEAEGRDIVLTLVALADAMLVFDRHKRPTAEDLLKTNEAFAGFSQNELLTCPKLGEQELAETEAITEQPALLDALRRLLVTTSSEVDRHQTVTDEQHVTADDHGEAWAALPKEAACYEDAGGIHQA
eukprot:Hpha_TRINITY_DN13387_c0_g1::TRINITY_DN13387_c0_g1_i2::g.95692::m.95692/K04371/MAPK1_3; mitogen-activated protein kinase 1/3